MVGNCLHLKQEFAFPALFARSPVQPPQFLQTANSPWPCFKILTKAFVYFLPDLRQNYQHSLPKIKTSVVGLLQKVLRICRPFNSFPF